MALLSCADCNAPVSSEAAACVRCGRPTRNGRVAPRKVATRKLGGTALMFVGLVIGFMGWVRVGYGDGEGGWALGCGIASLVVGMLVFTGGRFRES